MHAKIASPEGFSEEMVLTEAIFFERQRIKSQAWPGSYADGIEMLACTAAEVIPL
jgi:hypothetical protein